MTTEPITFADPDDLEPDPYTERLQELEHDDEHSYLPHYVHEDGSHTFVMHDGTPEHSNPREYDNVGHLVLAGQSARDYRPVDEDEEGIRDVRDHFSVYDERANPRGWSVGYYDSMIKRQAESRHTAEDMVRRYLSIYRPDIVAYVHEWQVNGTSQSDWQGGYAYVTREDYDAAGFTAEHLAAYPDDDLSPAGVLRGEIKVYGQWFAGEVYGAINVRRGEPVIVIGDEGAYVDGYEPKEEACWGFLGYASHRDIAAEVCASPITEEV